MHFRGCTMNDWVKITSIGAVAIVTVLSFVLLPGSTGLHDKLVYGLLGLAGAYGIGAGIKFTFDRLAGK